MCLCQEHLAYGDRQDAGEVHDDQQCQCDTFLIQHKLLYLCVQRHIGKENNVLKELLVTLMCLEADVQEGGGVPGLHGHGTDTKIFVNNG